MWRPSETSFSEQEDDMTVFRGELINNETITIVRRIINSLSTRKDHVIDFTDDNNFYNSVNAKVNVDKIGASKGIHGVNS